jgi:hypothetical protein
MRLPPVRSSISRIGVAVLTMALALLAGCEEHVGQSNAQNQPPQQPVTVLEGGGSAAGKAIESGQNLRDKVKAHNDAVEKQAEELSK